MLFKEGLGDLLGGEDAVDFFPTWKGSSPFVMPYLAGFCRAVLVYDGKVWVEYAHVEE